MRSVVLILFALFLPSLAVGKTCSVMTMTQDALEAWFNPHPGLNDYNLPMPLGLSLVFLPVPLGATGLYGDERTTYTMGASQPTIFETKLDVRVGSSIADKRGQAVMLIGKYELTKAQYAAVMGQGSLRDGLQILRQKSRDSRVQWDLDQYLEEHSPCHNTITSSLHRVLAEPLTFLSYRDYVEFLDAYNLFCISRNDCRKMLQSLGANRDVPGFVRLPAEHEWEFVVRGGGELVSGRMSKSDIQRDLPKLTAGKSITAFAHVGNEPAEVLPIGSREPLFGYYDMYGNAQELMGNAFTAENGYGAVGAYVARGGHFGLHAAELRASRRVELTAFRTDDVTGLLDIQYFPRTGIRLAVGLPVIGAAHRLGDNSLNDDFTANYVAPDQAGDTAGNIRSEARALGNLSDRPLEIFEELDVDDAEDWYSMALRHYGKISIEIEDGQGLIFELVDGRQKVLGRKASGSTTLIKTDDILPGTYWLQVRPGPKRIASEVRYSAVVTRSLAPDTGVARPDPVELSSAVALDSNNSVILQETGYVGPDDSIDTYPFINRSRHAGLEVKIDADADLIISLLDERLNLVQRKTISTHRSSVNELLSVPIGFRGFLQVEADPPAQTVYELEVRAKSPFDPVFMTVYSEAFNASARPGKTYEGKIVGKQSLYLPIRLPAAKTVRVELSGLDADVSMTVIGQARKEVNSSHARTGDQAEFFSEVLEAGRYVVSLKMENPAEESGFKIVYSVGAPTLTIPSPEEIRREARNNAESLGSLGSEVVSKFITAENTENYIKFNVTGLGMHNVSIGANSLSDLESFDITLETSSGVTLAKIIDVNDELEQFDAELNQGTYFLRIRRPKSVNSGKIYVGAFAIPSLPSLSSLPKKPDMSEFGILVERRKDFTIFQDGDQCFAVTTARSVNPAIGWRTHLPVFFVRVKRRNDSIGFVMDYSASSPYAPPNPGTLHPYWSGTTKARVLGHGQVAAVFRDGYLEPISKSANCPEYCIDSASLQRFRKGRTLIISGTTSDGRQGRVTYSLTGFQDAMRRINQICGADANWLWK